MFKIFKVFTNELLEYLMIPKSKKQPDFIQKIIKILVFIKTVDKIRFQRTYLDRTTLWLSLQCS